MNLGDRLIERILGNGRYLEGINIVVIHYIHV